MAHENFYTNQKLVQVEGDWIADVLRIWNEDTRAWDSHAPLTIRFDSLDLVVYAHEGGGLRWEANLAPYDLAPIERTPRGASHGSASQAIYEMEDGAPRATYDLVRFPALSAAVGSRVERVTAGRMSPDRASASRAPEGDAQRANSLELALDTNMTLTLTAQSDGALRASLAPTFEAPKMPACPQAHLPFGRNTHRS